jgi:hypothetical protein
MAQSDFVAFLRVAHRVIGEYLKEVEAAAPSSGASVEPVAPSATTAASGNGVPDARRAPATSPAAPGSRSGSRFEEVRTILLREMIERTGYPEEMLELDLDLEGELGIDTVKQVAAISSVRDHFQLDIDPNFKLRDHATLRKVITHIAGRLEPTGV